jgi:hypothetical protein
LESEAVKLGITHFVFADLVCRERAPCCSSPCVGSRNAKGQCEMILSGTASACSSVHATEEHRVCRTRCVPRALGAERGPQANLLGFADEWSVVVLATVPVVRAWLARDGHCRGCRAIGRGGHHGTAPVCLVVNEKMFYDVSPGLRKSDLFLSRAHKTEIAHTHKLVCVTKLLGNARAGGGEIDGGATKGTLMDAGSCL